MILRTSKEYIKIKMKLFTHTLSVCICIYVISFLIGDTAVYEGTGWHVRGSHTINYNSNSTGIAFIGDFSGI